MLGSEGEAMEVGVDQSGFIRQRRNLMLSSLVLLFAEVVELKVTKLSLFGNELLIGEPKAVNAALWIATVYWLIRFYQYSRQSFRNSIRTAIDARCSELAPALAKKIAMRDNKQLQMRFANSMQSPKVEWEGYTHRGHTQDYIRIEWLLKDTDVEAHGQPDGVLATHIISIEGRELQRLKLRAWPHMVIHTVVFTELILPYVLFGLPVVYLAYITLPGVL